MLINGPYPKMLKDRILGPKGHLSNKDSSVYLAKLIGDKTKRIVLTHLSSHNNTDELALSTIKETFKEYDIKFKNISCAHQKEMGEIIKV
jgi:phosphoribosyl 1,2-cyclic phosphodiesterase